VKNLSAVETAKRVSSQDELELKVSLPIDAWSAGRQFDGKNRLARVSGRTVQPHVHVETWTRGLVVKRTLLSFQRPVPSGPDSKKTSDSRQRPPCDSVRVVSDSLEGRSGVE